MSPRFVLKVGALARRTEGSLRRPLRELGRLAGEGKLVVAGPFGQNDRSYRGLYIFNVATVEDAEKLVILDPAVKAGVFIYELTPWYGSAAMMVVSETHKRIEQPKN